MDKYIKCEDAKAAFCRYMGFTSKRAALAVEAIVDKIPAADVVERPRWISVEERLPEINRAVLAYILWDDGERMTCFGCHMKTRWFLWHSDLGELLKDFMVTHWMPLPEPPVLQR